MSQTLNVLSIDFDYFQKVSRDILLNDYPQDVIYLQNYQFILGQDIIIIQSQQKNFKK